MTDKRSGKSGPINMVLDDELDMMLIDYDEGAVVEIAEARAAGDVIAELCAGRKVPMMVDFAGLRSQSKDSRHYFANDVEMLSNFTAVAILVNSALTKVIANFYMGINKPKIPTRMFDDRDAALAWLEGTR